MADGEEMIYDTSFYVTACLINRADRRRWNHCFCFETGHYFNLW